MTSTKNSKLLGYAAKLHTTATDHGDPQLRAKHAAIVLQGTKSVSLKGATNQRWVLHGTNTKQCEKGDYSCRNGRSSSTTQS